MGAEYRELPRIIGLVRVAVSKGERYDDPRNPPAYTLGLGHCRFFYPRLAFLVQRHHRLVTECCARGRKVTFPHLNTEGIPAVWFGSYTPTPEALRLNLERIAERGGLRAGYDPKEILNGYRI